MKLAYLTDVEGRWDKLASFTAQNPCLALVDGALRLADDTTFVFGGDAIDRGPDARRIVRLLLAAQRTYGDGRVILLAGNRDINKLRLHRELAGHPPEGAPPEASRPALLRWIFANTMGAGKAFDHRAAELATEGRPAGDDAVVDSFLTDIAVGGDLHAYLGACRLGFRAGATLFLHGGVTAENFGEVPELAARATTTDAWLAALNAFYAREIAAYTQGTAPETLIAYQAPVPGTHENPGSVVYSRPTDDIANPLLPDPDVIARLRADGIGRLVVGHTPSGDCPAILRDGDFELVLGDNSYSRIELGNQLAFTDDETRVHAITELDDGTHVAIDYTTARTAAAASPLGRRDRATGQLVKSQLVDGRFLLFRGLPKYRVEQLAAPAADLATRDLVTPR